MTRISGIPSVAALLGVVALAAGCSSTATPVAAPASSSSSASGSSTGASSDVPAAIQAAGGTSLLAGPYPDGIDATYGPMCKAADYNGGISPIDFTKDTIGFSQGEKEANPFRTASTKSMKDEATKRGWHLLTTNAQSNLQQQNADIKSLIDQGAKAVIFSPLNSQGLDDAINYAKSKKVPIIPVDRNITGKQACSDVAAQLGSDFIDQGKRAADKMIEATGGTANLAILLGASGVNVTDDRTKGFKDEIAAKAPGIKVVFEQTGNFTREQGKSVSETMLRSHPEVNAIYAENDEMGLGALAALEDAGKAGTSKVHIVSIDGTKGAVSAIVDGNFDAVIESNPRYGPSSFDALEAFFKDGVPAVTITTDGGYDKTNAKTDLAKAF